VATDHSGYPNISFVSDYAESLFLAREKLRGRGLTVVFGQKKTASEEAVD
jgi:hypothetical protein